ncbi:ThuA domain-containing protein [Luteimonas salinilitoris]|uniref:ThuA domain-containing protein n=1 Tax=Luteimonas salinilitoris TaxID=3237697 RepID=A0ABV4HYW2_9GAMM
MSAGSSVFSTDARRASSEARRAAGALVGLAAAAALWLSPAPEAVSASPQDDPDVRVLVFTKTAGFRHNSIPDAVAALRELGAEHGIAIVHSEDGASFTDANLAGYRAVVFANTTQDVLDASQQAAMEAFIRNGGGFLGLHSASDTEYDWPWYGELVGAWFDGHPPGLQTSRVHLADPATVGIGSDDKPWQVTDEFYNFRRNPREQVRVIAALEPSDYIGSTMGGDHPITWCREYDGGRTWYTGLGHDSRLYADAVFLRHVARGLRYVTGIDDAC